MSREIVWFGKIPRKDVARAGGKGANLGELLRADIPVPPGFVVTADAYLDAMSAGGARESLEGWPRTSTPTRHTRSRRPPPSRAAWSTRPA